MKTALVLALIPCAILAACNRSPDTSSTSKYGNDSPQPAAGTGTDTYTSPRPTDPAVQQGTTTPPPSEAIRNGEAVPPAPGTSNKTHDPVAPDNTSSGNSTVPRQRL